MRLSISGQAQGLKPFLEQTVSIQLGQHEHHNLRKSRLPKAARNQCHVLFPFVQASRIIEGCSLCSYDVCLFAAQSSFSPAKSPREPCWRSVSCHKTGTAPNPISIGHNVSSFVIRRAAVLKPIEPSHYGVCSLEFALNVRFPPSTLPVSHLLSFLFNRCMLCSPSSCSLSHLSTCLDVSWRV